MFILNPNSGTPIYQQLIDQVRRQVASGQLAPGTEMPSVRELAQQHTVHQMTVSKAYVLLEIEGVLERHRGKPMRVAPPRPSQSSLPARLRQLDPQVDSLVLSARQLGLSADEVVDQIRRKMGSSQDARRRLNPESRQLPGETRRIAGRHR